MHVFLDPHNHLFELARTGKWLPHIVLVVILTFVFIVVAQLMGGIPAVILIGLLSVLSGDQLPLENQEAMVNLLLPDTALERAILLVLAFGPIFLVLGLAGPV